MQIRDASQHTFDTIIGQDLVKRFLLRTCASGQTPQALLFTGPAGVGKRSLMYAFAKHLVTRSFERDDERIARGQGKIERGTHPDVIVIEPKSASGQILKAQIDEMQERAYYAPLESPFKVILISPVEAMNAVAANHLLKILEEPPPALHIFLSSQQIHQTLATIRSRCAILRCPPVEMEPLTAWLIDACKCTQRRAETAARLSGGRPGLALDLISGEDAERRRRISTELDFFHREGYPSIFRVGNNLLDAAGTPSEAIASLVVWFRDLLVASLTAQDAETADESLLMNRDMIPEVETMAARFHPRGLARALEKILDRRNQTIYPFIDSDLLLEVLLTDIGVALKS